MTALTQLYDYVLPEVPGCEPPLALQHIRLAAIDLYARARLRELDLSGMSTVASIASYTLAGVPTDYVFHEMTRVSVDGESIGPIKPGDRDRLYPEWETTTDQPAWYYLEDDDTLTLFPTPDGVYAVRARASIKPSPTAAGIDDWVFNQFFQVIAHGALATLLAVPKKPWTDPGTAQYYANLFARGVAGATEKVSSGLAHKARRTRPRFGLS